MTLSYPGAEAYVESIHAALRLIYPAIPPCLFVQDEPSGDFGIAHFWGLTDDWTPHCAAQLTFDNDRVPRRYVITHELGHALSASVRTARGNVDGFTDGLYDEFWDARGWRGAPLAPATPMYGQLQAIALNNAGNYSAAYRQWPEENFADTFGVVNTPFAFPITADYGVWLDQAKLLDFYKGLKGEDFMSQSDIDAAVAASMASFGLDGPTFAFIKERLKQDANHDHGVLTSAGQPTDMSTTKPRETK